MRLLFKGGSRSAPVTPTSSPSMPSKKDLSAKQVRDQKGKSSGIDWKILALDACGTSFGK